MKNKIRLIVMTNSPNSIFMAIFENRLDDVANLAKQGLANAVLGGDSALIYAIDQKNYRAAKILLDAGVDPNQKNALGDNALHIAAKWNIAELLDIILDYPIDLNIVGQDGFTAINYAAAFGNYDIVNNLASKGADPDIKDNVFHLSARQRAKKDGIDL